MVDDVLFFAVLILAICLGISVLVLANNLNRLKEDDQARREEEQRRAAINRFALDKLRRYGVALKDVCQIHPPVTTHWEPLNWVLYGDILPTEILMSWRDGSVVVKWRSHEGLYVEAWGASYSFDKESDMSSDQLRTLLSALIERPVPLGQVLSDDEATAVGTA
jgi:hypothetical protein